MPLLHSLSRNFLLALALLVGLILLSSSCQAQGMIWPVEPRMTTRQSCAGHNR
jgi:hypothetical protein